MSRCLQCQNALVLDAYARCVYCEYSVQLESIASRSTSNINPAGTIYSGPSLRFSYSPYMGTIPQPQTHVPNPQASQQSTMPVDTTYIKQEELHTAPQHPGVGESSPSTFRSGRKWQDIYAPMPTQSMEQYRHYLVQFQPLYSDKEIDRILHHYYIPRGVQQFYPIASGTSPRGNRGYEAVPATDNTRAPRSNQFMDQEYPPQPGHLPYLAMSTSSFSIAPTAIRREPIAAGLSVPEERVHSRQSGSGRPKNNETRAEYMAYLESLNMFDSPVTLNKRMREFYDMAGHQRRR